MPIIEIDTVTASNINAAIMLAEAFQRDCLTGSPDAELAFARLPDDSHLLYRTLAEIDPDPRPRLFGLLATLDGEPAGIALWHFTYEGALAMRAAYVSALWVEPEFRRSGIATRLLASIAATAVEHGARFLAWASVPAASDADAFYRSLGADQMQSTANVLHGPALRKISLQGQSQLAAA